VVRSRRGRGEGSVYFVERRNEWCASVSFGIDDNGRRQRRTYYAPSKVQALQLLNDARLRAGAELSSRSNVSFKEFVSGWLEREVKPNRRATTARYYQVIVDRVMPTLGRKRMAEISTADIERTIAAVRELSSSTMAAKARGTLRRIFKRALAVGAVTVNPVEATEAPRVAKSQMQFLTAKQVQKLFKAARGQRMGPLVVLLAATGLRLGEALALTWADVDLRTRTLKVTKTLQDDMGPLVVVEPKTATGRRTVHFGTTAVDALRERRRAAQSEGFAGSRDPVFPTTAGTYQRRKNLHTRFWRPLLTKAKLPTIRLHDLRHTSASLSLAAGSDPRTISERLGHADAGFTMRTYAHSVKHLHQEDAIGIDRLLISTRKRR
jgi:integrase